MLVEAGAAGEPSRDCGAERDGSERGEAARDRRTELFDLVEVALQEDVVDAQL